MTSWQAVDNADLLLADMTCCLMHKHDLLPVSIKAQRNIALYFSYALTVPGATVTDGSCSQTPQNAVMVHMH